MNKEREIIRVKMDPENGYFDERIMSITTPSCEIGMKEKNGVRTFTKDISWNPVALTFFSENIAEEFVNVINENKNNTCGFMVIVSGEFPKTFSVKNVKVTYRDCEKVNVIPEFCELMM